MSSISSATDWLIFKGSFECKCKSGYDGDGLTCSDFDECANNMHDCDVHADCKNTIGTYKCECHIGYGGSGLTNDCHNIDECKTRTHDCNNKGHDNTQCVDNDGSFDCYCKKGSALLNNMLYKAYLRQKSLLTK